MSSKTGEGNKEVVGVLLFFLGIALVLMFYLPADVTGTLGSFVKNLGFGLVGIMAYCLFIWESTTSLRRGKEYPRFV